MNGKVDSQGSRRKVQGYPRCAGKRTCWPKVELPKIHTVSTLAKENRIELLRTGVRKSLVPNQRRSTMSSTEGVVSAQVRRNISSGDGTSGSSDSSGSGRGGSSLSRRSRGRRGSSRGGGSSLGGGAGGRNRSLGRRGGVVNRGVSLRRGSGSSAGRAGDYYGLGRRGRRRRTEGMGVGRTVIRPVSLDSDSRSSRARRSSIASALGAFLESMEFFGASFEDGVFEDARGVAVLSVVHICRVGAREGASEERGDERNGE